MTEDELLHLACSLGLERAVAMDPAGVLSAARRARTAVTKIALETGRFGEPWPPMKAMG